jgi:hypothetical protein
MAYSIKYSGASAGMGQFMLRPISLSRANTAEAHKTIALTEWQPAIGGRRHGYRRALIIGVPGVAAQQTLNALIEVTEATGR